jgi:hypothetical protein
VISRKARVEDWEGGNSSGRKISEVICTEGKVQIVSFDPCLTKEEKVEPCPCMFITEYLSLLASGCSRGDFPWIYWRHVTGVLFGLSDPLSGTQDRHSQRPIWIEAKLWFVTESIDTIALKMYKRGHSICDKEGMTPIQHRETVSLVNRGPT